MKFSTELSPDFVHNRAEYDRFWSKRWRRTHNFSSQTKLKRFRALMDKHGLLKKESVRVFDQGFGLGLMLFAFRPSCSLGGLELSPGAVDGAQKVAKKKGYADVDLRVYELGASYPEEWKERFDLVISSHVLEHIEDPRPALDDLLSLLKPGGMACVIVPINELPGEDLNHFHNFTPSSLENMLEASGLEKIETFEADRLWHLMAPVAYKQVRKSTFTLRCLSTGLNLAGFFPRWMLSLADVFLKLFGYPNRQYFTLFRKPGKRGSDKDAA